MINPTHTTRDIQQVLVLPSGLLIPLVLADNVRHQVLRRIHDLERDRSYSLKEICGKEFWSTLDKSDAIKAGRYIAYLVSKDQLPLIFAVCPHQSNKKYRLK